MTIHHTRRGVRKITYTIELRFSGSAVTVQGQKAKPTSYTSTQYAMQHIHVYDTRCISSVCIEYMRRNACIYKQTRGRMG